MIKVDNICKSFKQETVLKNVSAYFEPGEISGIIGKNGSGKTVFFKIICGFMKPDSGEVRFYDETDGEYITIGKDVDFPENIGVIIEAPGFLPYRSGFSNLIYLASLRGKIGREEVIRAMKLVGLDPNLKKGVGKYSLGMRQRLGIAQAIMEDPEFLILDEPFNGLDEQGVREMRELLLSLKAQDKTILIASHMKEDIDLLCDVVYEMKNGVLEQISPVTEEDIC
ncbi:MAG: ATP-binding cassette domain-containing protein [Christensenellaceae bacterium]|nr:ATP-binding cassette domain-containing protein [Christensenellaceae bacterium]